jgi:hypothetical protein
MSENVSEIKHGVNLRGICDPERDLRCPNPKYEGGEMGEDDKYNIESKIKSKREKKRQATRKVEKSWASVYGFHTGTLLLGDFIAAGKREARLSLRNGELLRGVEGRRKLSSPSTRLRNWIAVRGDPGEECVFIDWGLFPLGLDRANEGSKIPLLPLPGSGVFGLRGGVVTSSGASKRVEELIHFSSLEPI